MANNQCEDLTQGMNALVGQLKRQQDEMRRQLKQLHDLVACRAEYERRLAAFAPLAEGKNRGGPRALRSLDAAKHVGLPKSTFFDRAREGKFGAPKVDPDMPGTKLWLVKNLDAYLDGLPDG